nr:DoxX-like family protein [Defluviimonas salinarum]
MVSRVLVLGADGFIGRHIAFALRAGGHAVVAVARRPERLAAMGFAVLRVDLCDPACHTPAFWTPHLADGTHLVIAAGLLTGADAAFAAVHEAAPRAAYAARDGGRAVLISAVGITADTPFAAWRRRGEAVARAAGNVTILRPGLVLADTSYGGSSLLRALAALPVRRVVVGTGAEPCNPIHADDLASVVSDCLAAPPGAGPAEGAWEIGGPEHLSQDALSALLRSWLGLAPAPVLRVPYRFARVAGRVGDALRLGPVSTTAVAQLRQGIAADPAPLLARIAARPEPVSRFLCRRPAGTQDLWQARLYLLKPLLRLVLAAMWLVSGLLGLLLPPAAFTPVLAAAPLPEAALVMLARAGGLLDLALAAALLRDWRPRQVGWAQLALVAAYTSGLSILAPDLWLAPFGELLKNLPVMALILVHLALAEER